MQDKYNQYVAKWNGKPQEVEDASALDQCMDNAFGWSDFIGIPHSTIRAFAAKDVINRYDHNSWTQAGSPQVGDLVTWGANVGAAGHIAVFSKDLGGGKFQSYDQNWDGHKKINPATGNMEPYCEFVTHTYSGVQAYLRPKVTFNGGSDVIDLNTGRRLLFWIYGLNGTYSTKNALNGDADSQIKPLVGQDTNTVIQQLTDDQYGQAYKNWLAANPTSGKPLPPGTYTVK